MGSNRHAARIIGINVPRVSSQIFVLTSAFGGFVAFFIAASLHQITPGFGLWATVKGLIVMILGGIGSIPGAILGGFLLGIVELQALWYFGGGYRDLVAFLLLFLFLIVRPRGLLGCGEGAPLSGSR
ncbi:MAG: ABC transporter permease subunit [Gammaproteobacteria bacterium]